MSLCQQHQGVPHGRFIRPFGFVRYHKNTSHRADVVKGCIFPVWLPVPHRQFNFSQWNCWKWVAWLVVREDETNCVFLHLQTYNGMSILLWPCDKKIEQPIKFNTVYLVWAQNAIGNPSRSCNLSAKKQAVEVRFSNGFNQAAIFSLWRKYGCFFMRRLAKKSVFPHLCFIRNTHSVQSTSLRRSNCCRCSWPVVSR